MKTNETMHEGVPVLSPFPEGWYFVARRKTIEKLKLVRKTWPGQDYLCGPEAGRYAGRRYLGPKTLSAPPGALSFGWRDRQVSTLLRTVLSGRPGLHAARQTRCEVACSEARSGLRPCQSYRPNDLAAGQRVASLSAMVDPAMISGDGAGSIPVNTILANLTSALGSEQHEKETRRPRHTAVRCGCCFDEELLWSNGRFVLLDRQDVRTSLDKTGRHRPTSEICMNIGM